MAAYIKIGKIVGAHGLKGELVLRHVLGKKTSLKGLQAVFIEENKNSFLPWFIRLSTIKKEEEIYLKLEGIDSRETALKLLQKDIWLPEADFQKLVAKTAPVKFLGYNVIHEKKSLGPVLEVIEQPHQVLCRLEINQKEVLIPLNEGTLQKIDHKKKDIFVVLPDGLLDVYLNL
ncbi:MAG: 16S rRNA processing protein RimM [Bacteroidetes bacterium]|nr:16S rRNA processing protein RimM [Bacteroidota bacterium]MBS1632662.1 16S rRNA processing protein RimM [Bacteroidota bacterium]